MKIDFVLPALTPRVTGGIWCLLRHANELVKRGHNVRLIAPRFNGLPPDCEILPQLVVPHNDAAGESRLLASHIATSLLRKIGLSSADALKDTRMRLLRLLRRKLSWSAPMRGHAEMCMEQIRLAEYLQLVSDVPDVTIATAFQTVMPVWIASRGRKVYFMQHFEEFFSNDYADPDSALEQASATYRLPIRRIANSRWLQVMLRERYGESVPVVNNAIDQAFFFPGVPKDSPRDCLTLACYGDTAREWKGFATALDTVSILRTRGYQIDFRVFGNPEVSSRVDLEPFTRFGWLTKDRLADVYRSIDILLCPAWYESFPLYPLEAMACGACVVTTPFGVEDYASHGENCLIVPARSPVDMADAVERLWNDPLLARKVKCGAAAIGKSFTWSRAGDAMEKALTAIIADVKRAHVGDTASTRDAEQVVT